MEELGRYKVGAELGEGPYAVAYEAQDDGERCVLKVLKDEAVPGEPGRRAGLVRALEGLKEIDHPSVVKVLDGGEEAGKLFVATEFMDRPTLQQKLQDQASLPEQQVVLFVRQTAQALDKARDLGYCHGNLTVRNVFVVSEEKVKVADFALAALVKEPPDIAELEDEGDLAGLAAAEDDWVTAEDLLRTKGKRTTTGRLEDDLVGLAVLMMQMLGVSAPERGAEQSLEAYRTDLLRDYYPRLTSPEAGVGLQTTEVVRRLLTAGGFGSPGEVVVELASAMLLGRTFARARAEAVAAPASASETAQVRGALEETPEPVPSSAGDLSVLEFRGDPCAAPFTPLFIWSDRHRGRFFVIHDGERLTIGRDPDVCDITLMDPAVSRQHCTLSKDGGVVRIEDPGSSNGTFVNEQRVQNADIHAGDRLRIGGTRVYLSLPGREK